MIVGVIGVVGAIAYLVWQSRQDASDQLQGGKAAEANADPTLPGEWVDLVTIYGGPYGKTAGHVSRAVDYAKDCGTTDAGDEVCNTNPPVGGPHWFGTCGEDPENAPSFCGPAPWGIYTAPWDPESVVHNMEHGGIVLWYNTTNEEIISELQDDINGKLKGGVLIVMMPYPDMDAETIAVTSWSRLDKFPVSDYTKKRVDDFISAHDRRFNPEKL